jgi:hypothetical protein
MTGRARSTVRVLMQVWMGSATEGAENAIDEAEAVLAPLAAIANAPAQPTSRTTRVRGPSRRLVKFAI